MTQGMATSIGAVLAIGVVVWALAGPSFTNAAGQAGGPTGIGMQSGMSAGHHSMPESQGLMEQMQEQMRSCNMGHGMGQMMKRSGDGSHCDQ